MSAQPFVCGQVRRSQGRAPAGWVALRAAGGGSAPWFCGLGCLAVYLAGQLEQDAAPAPDHGDPQPPLPEDAFAAVAALGRASGTGLTWLSATPARLDRAHELACARIQRRAEQKLCELGDLLDHALAAVRTQEQQDRADRLPLVDPQVAAALLAEHLAASGAA